MFPEPANDYCARRDVTALVLAAGEGKRLGGMAKAFVEFNGHTLLEHALNLVTPFAHHLRIGVRASDLASARQQCAAFVDKASIQCLAGGETRQGTLTRLLATCTTPYVLIHEVARPWVEPADFQNLLEAVSKWGAVALYTPVPVRDSLALIENGVLVQALPRSKVVSLQAPHAYQRSLLVRVHALAAEHGWNEESTAALVMRAREQIHLVEGSPRNLKITYPEDLRTLVDSPPDREVLSHSLNGAAWTPPGAKRTIEGAAR